MSKSIKHKHGDKSIKRCSSLQCGLFEKMNHSFISKVIVMLLEKIARRRENSMDVSKNDCDINIGQEVDSLCSLNCEKEKQTNLKKSKLQ